MHVQLLIFELVLINIINSYDVTTIDNLNNHIFDDDNETTTQESIYDEFTMTTDDGSLDMEETTTDIDDETRILNKDFDRLGKIYVLQYYALFDDPNKRLSLVALYHPEDSFLTFEGRQYRGTRNILKQYEKLQLKSLQRNLIAIDTQPLVDGGVIINVVGKVQESENQENIYSQTFVYKPHKGSFLLQHDIFRVIRP